MFLLLLVYRLVRFIVLTVVVKPVLFLAGLIVGFKESAPVLYAEHKDDVRKMVVDAASTELKRGTDRVNNGFVSLSQRIEERKNTNAA